MIFDVEDKSNLVRVDLLQTDSVKVHLKDPTGDKIIIEFRFIMYMALWPKSGLPKPFFKKHTLVSAGTSGVFECKERYPALDEGFLVTMNNGHGVLKSLTSYIISTDWFHLGLLVRESPKITYKL